MPKDPLPAASPGKLPTEAHYIGHVAPSFKDEELWNSLVVRPQYRMSLRMGDIDQLCPNKPDTEAGRMERLQILGLFYYPLKHSMAKTAFNGKAEELVKASNPAGPKFPRVVGAWEYARTKVFQVADDAGADTAVKDQLGERILDGLPPAAEDPKKPKTENFGKIRLPGGYAFVDAFGGDPLDFNKDAAYPMGFGADLYGVETKYRDDNPVLGKIPLIATVEKLDPYTQEWKPAKDAWVYFQLVDPYELPAYDPAVSVLDQVNRPPLRESTFGPPGANTGKGPHKFTKDREKPPSGAMKPDDADPQRFNAHTNQGGLRGKRSLNDNTDVADVVFLTTSFPGFNAKHAPAREKEFDIYSLASKATVKGDSHKHAVKAKTNDKGEAGVIFAPSRCAGDRYRIRAYIGPADVNAPKMHESDGTGPRAVAVDTGTLVIWRNTRVSRYIRQEVTGAHADLITDFNADYALGGVAATTATYLGLAQVDPASPTVGAADFAAIPASGSVKTQLAIGDPYDGLRISWAKAFLELETDPGISLPEDLTDAEWRTVRQNVVHDMRNNLGKYGLQLNLDRLFLMDNANIGVNDSVVHMPMRTDASYNTAFGATSANRINLTGASGNNRTNIDNLFWSVIVASLARHLGNCGYKPGLTLVTGGFGASWQLWGHIDQNSGLAVQFRSGFVWLSHLAYPATQRGLGASGFTYSYSSNCQHELGHVQYRQHAPGGGSGGPNAARHDPVATNDSTCVMSYQKCEGQFCAKCLFALRGWNIDAAGF
jgi:hypothetical protein